MLKVTGPAGALEAGVFTGEGITLAETGIFVAIDVDVAGDPGCVVAVAAIVAPGVTFCPQPASNITAILIHRMLIM